MKFISSDATFFYDLIPEWVPVFGILDDLALAALLIAWASSYRSG